MTADKTASVDASAEPGDGKNIEPDTSGASELGEGQMGFLIAEADHFFRGELAHEQRASWLLALAAGLQLALWRLLSTDQFQEAGDLAFYMILITLGTLTLAIALALMALWPLAGGKHPRLLEPWGRDRDHSYTGKGLPPVPKRLAGPVGPTLWNHYLAHRRRAEIKGRRVVRVNIALFVSLFLGASGFLATVLE